MTPEIKRNIMESARAADPAGLGPHPWRELDGPPPGGNDAQVVCRDCAEPFAFHAWAEYPTVFAIPAVTRATRGKHIAWLNVGQCPRCRTIWYWLEESPPRTPRPPRP